MANFAQYHHPPRHDDDDEAQPFVSPFEQDHISHSNLDDHRPASTYTLTESYGVGAQRMPPYNSDFGSNDPYAHQQEEVPYGIPGRAGSPYSRAETARQRHGDSDKRLVREA